MSDNIFSNEYVKGSETKLVPGDLKENSNQKDYFKIDTQKYGLAKPKRIIIKGRISDGQS